MKLKWKNMNYAQPLPAEFYGRGIETADGRYYVSARFFNSRGSAINWGVINWKTNTYTDGFQYRRDAVAFVEAGGFDGG